MDPPTGSSRSALCVGLFFFCLFSFLAVPSLVNVHAHRVHRVKSCGASVDSQPPEGCRYIVQLIGNEAGLVGHQAFEWNK